MRSLALILSFAVLWLASIAAIKNDRFTASWDVPTDQTAIYEFRWTHFASPDWIALPSQPSGAGTFTTTFKPLPTEPSTDRWMCLDARSVVGELTGPWLSETKDGAACGSVEVGTVVVPPPPPVVPPPTPPQPPPPTETFSNLTNSKGVLSFDYQLTDCKRGVQQTASTIRNGIRTITLTCRR